MTNDCRCSVCSQFDNLGLLGFGLGWMVEATQTVYEQDGKPVARKGTPGTISDIDSSDRWVIVEFEGAEPTICYPHEVRARR